MTQALVRPLRCQVARLHLYRRHRGTIEVFAMETRPYEDTFRYRGDLCFFAEVPALTHIGKRFDELADECFEYTAPDEELERWKQLSARLGEYMKQVREGKVTHWAGIQKQLERDFGEHLKQATQRIAGPIHEYFQTGQMPLAEYLEWVLHGAESMWALNGGAAHGQDMEAFQARVDRLTARLQSAGYESETDRQLRAEDPETYEFLTKSLDLMMGSMNESDPEAFENIFENMMSKQMELFRQSPMFEQAQQSLDQMREQIEALRESDPALYQEQMEHFEQMRRFTEDPTSAIEEMVTAEAGGDEESDDEDADMDDHAARVVTPGSLQFNCGQRDSVSADQINQFKDFIERQEALRREIEVALRELHKWMDQGSPFRLPSDSVLFPENPDESDVPLQCFRIREVDLEPDARGRIVLVLDSQFGHFDEHGCYIEICDGEVKSFGTWDDVFGGDDFDEEE
jgi:hypothetical protein